MTQGSVLNLNHGEIYLDYKFINILKQGQRPIQNQDGGPLVVDWINDINALHYPTEAVVGTKQLQYWPETGTYVARWTGSGSMSIGDATSVTNSSSGIYTGGGANGSVVTNGRFTFTRARGSSQLTLKGSANFANAVICLASEEALLDAGLKLRPRFKELITEFNPKALRMMDAQSMNLSIQGQNWDDNMPAECLSFSGTTWRPNKKVGLISGTDTYTAPSYTGMPVTYQHGEFWHGHVENSNTLTEVTMDSGGRGAKRVIGGYGQDHPGTIANTGSNSALRLIADTNYTFWYDAYFDEILFAAGGAQMGMPIEAMVDIANETGVPLWLSIPFYASDAWVLALANYLDTNYTPAIIYIEFVNEPWNSASGFLNYSRCKRAGGVTMGLTGSAKADQQGYVGLRFRQIEAIMRPVLGSGLKMLLAGQGAQASSEANLSAGVENVLFQNTSTSVSGTLGTPNANIGGANAPILVADGISYGLYYHGDRIAWLDATWTTKYDNPPDGVTGIDDVLLAADNFALGTRAGIMAAFMWLYDVFHDYMEIITHLTTGRFALWNDLAVEYDKPVLLYEVNHEFAAPSTSWCTGKGISATYGGVGGKIDLMFQGFMNSPQYERIAALYLKRFYAFSKSEAFSAYSMGLGAPWQFFPLQTTTSALGGDTMQEGFGNWRANCNSNNGYTSLQLGETV